MNVWLPLAHGVGRVYELPIPLYLYLLAAAATVIASFVVQARSRQAAATPLEHRIGSEIAAGRLATALRIGGLIGLVLAIAGAVMDPGRGFTLATLTLWVGLVIGGAVLSSVVAGSWDAADPWSTLGGLWRHRRDDPDPPPEPASLRKPPAFLMPVALYALFWFELVSGAGFEGRGVLIALALYTVYREALVVFFGPRGREADPLAVLFDFAAEAAPFELRDDGLYRRPAVASLARDEPMPTSRLVALFVLLASTTFDNARETVGWGELTASLGLVDAPERLVDSAALALLTLPFLLLFAGTIVVARKWIPPARSNGELMRLFAWSLIPIGVAYVLAHNTSLVISGLPLMVDEVLDLLGLPEQFDAYLPSPALVWYLEIALIVGGHILGVIAAHRIALQEASTRAQAVKSQYAMTALMSIFTVTTLWLLALPIVRN